LKRIFDNSKDCEIYAAIAGQPAAADRNAYSFIENEVFWPSFKKYLKEHHNFEYDLTAEGVEHHKYAGPFQATINRYVEFEGRVFFWKITDTFLEPDVWELDAGEIILAMGELSRLRRMSPLRVLWWRLKQ